MATNKEQVLERIMICRIGMMMPMSFWGNLITRMPIRELSESDSCHTAATDGRNIFYYPDFFEPLTDGQIVFVMMHEVLHVVLNHLGRARFSSHKHHQIGNLAADFAANQILVSENIGKHIGSGYITKADLVAATKKEKDIKEMGTLYDPIYANMSYEEIYEDLLETAEELEKEGYIKPMAGSGFDSHEDWDSLSEEEKQKIKDAIRDSVVSAANGVGAGNVPGSMRRFLGDLLTPKLNWKQLLTKKIESQVRSVRTYARLNRRASTSNFIFPSKAPEQGVTAVLAVDVSGSIGNQEIREFFTECVHLFETYANFKIGVLCFDTRGYNYQEYDQYNSDEILSYDLTGGGGTDFSGIFKYLKELEIVPEQLVIFTDGETHDFGDPDYCDTVFVIKNTREVTPPYGETVSYD